ncbi:hypothetical protein [Carboxylicivirga linearis]|uniref:Uncharacterized protein n=1 Tax=Carboxylicivirga linearis TaxID=1628157 RepID=A0ABS5JWD2_9BACT|nr:hypothetical protein [Carboxylicivirga linearis]MBS2099133.1 hypothetical protein [Carboxylicivirga linearis]
MKSTFEKIYKALEIFAQKHGEFNFCGVFLREDSNDKWDLILSSEWMLQNKGKALREITDILPKKLNQFELIKLSRIVILEEEQVNSFSQAFSISGGSSLEISNSNIFGMQIKLAYLKDCKSYL